VWDDEYARHSRAPVLTLLARTGSNDARAVLRKVSQSRSVEELAPRTLSLCRKSARIFNGSKVVLLGATIRGSAQWAEHTQAQQVSVGARWHWPLPFHDGIARR
jgi:hypothetical protein